MKHWAVTARSFAAVLNPLAVLGSLTRIVVGLTRSRPAWGTEATFTKRLIPTAAAFLNAALFFVVVALPSPSFAQDSIDFEWVRQFAGLGPADDSGYGVVAAGGFVYIVGDTEGTLPGQVRAGGSADRDVFLRKYDSDGTEVWTRQFGTPELDDLNRVAISGTDVYVAGETSGAFPGESNVGDGFDVFVRKYDGDGNVQWTRQFGSEASDTVLGIVVDATGVYIAGRTRGTLPGQTSSGSNDAFIRKYGHDGTELWTEQFGTPGNDDISGVASDGVGVYVVGSVGYGDALPGQTSSGQTDAFVRRYTPDGVEVWTRQFGTSQVDFGIGVALNASGVYVAGRTLGPFPGFPDPAGQDTFVRKYDFDGNEQWTDQITGSTTHASAIGTDATGVYVGGSTNTSIGGPYLGSGDAWVRKYDAGGTELWTRQFGTPQLDRVFGLASDGFGVFAVGETDGALPGHTSDGWSDVFLVRLDPGDGAEVWTEQFGGFNPSSSASAVDAEGSAYVAGTLRGFFADQSNAGSSDAFVRKYDCEGAEVWTAQIGTTDFDEARGVYVDATGVYVAGRSRGLLSDRSIDAFFLKLSPADGSLVWEDRFEVAPGRFGPGALGVSGDATGVYFVGTSQVPLPSQNMLPGSTPGGAFVRKYDVDGNELWTTQFDFFQSPFGGRPRFGVANAVDADGAAVYVAGTNRVGGAFVRKFDTDGNEVWKTDLVPPVSFSAPTAHGVSVDATGVYVVGTAQILFTDFSTAFVQKLDHNGDELWTREIGQPDARDTASGVAADGQGVYVVGHLCALDACNAYIYRYDLDGNLLGLQEFGTPEFDTATGVSVSSTGVYVAGFTLGTLPGQALASGAYIARVRLGPLDTDGDGVPDDVDVCPTEDATGFDADGDGCIDSLVALPDVLESLVSEGVIDPTMQTSLISKLNNVEASVDRENICAAVNQLEAFQNQIEAQRGKKISDEAATVLIDFVENIIVQLLLGLPDGESCG